MDNITENDAIRNVIVKLNLPGTTPGRAWRVRRLDHPSEAYYLVELGHSNAATAVGIVDAGTGEIGSYANLPGTVSHITLNAARAAELAGGGEAAHVELVWMACNASKSPLYPLWEVRTASGLRYVDQQGHVIYRLAPATPGG